MNKKYITASELLRDSFSLAKQIFNSGYRPTFIIGIWRGGTPIAIAVQEVLKVCGVETDHIAVRTSAYAGIEQRKKEILIHDLNYVLENIKANDQLLIIDDVHDSGLSLNELLIQLKAQCGQNHPVQIRIATVYYKPNKSEVAFEPNYFIHKTDDWIVFPHELDGLTIQELLGDKPEIDSIKSLLENQQTTSNS